MSLYSGCGCYGEYADAYVGDCIGDGIATAPYGRSGSDHIIDNEYVLALQFPGVINFEQVPDIDVPVIGSLLSLAFMSMYRSEIVGDGYRCDFVYSYGYLFGLVVASSCLFTPVHRYGYEYVYTVKESVGVKLFGTQVAESTGQIRSGEIFCFYDELSAGTVPTVFEPGCRPLYRCFSYESLLDAVEWYSVIIGKRNVDIAMTAYGFLTVDELPAAHLAYRRIDYGHQVVTPDSDQCCEFHRDGCFMSSIIIPVSKPREAA